MKRILIVSPYFAPENAIASVRFTKIAKYLSKKGYDVSVICCEEIATSKKDRILEDDCDGINHIYRLKPVSIYSGLGKWYTNLQKKNETVSKNKTTESRTTKAKKNHSLFDKIVGNKWYQIGAEAWWYLMEKVQGYAFIRFYRRNKHEIGIFDCVISTYGPTSSHIMGNYLKKKGYCRKWIADYRDVIYETIRVENPVIRRKKKLLGRFCLEADYVTAITEDLLKHLEEYVRIYHKKSIRKKCVCIPNGFDMEDRHYLADDSNSQLFEIAYCGVIYYNLDNLLRDPRPMFQAVAELAEEGTIDKSKVVFHYAGRNYEVYSKFANQYGLENNIVNHGFVERYQSLDIQNSCDLILSLSWNTSKEKGIMTGKIFEALLVGKNVLAIISGDEPGSNLKDMIDTCQIGYAWEKGSGAAIHELKDVILKYYEEKMQNHSIEYCGKSDEIRKYTYDYIADKFIELL